jgi:alanine dehydrogenase
MHNAESVWAASDMIIKVKEPLPAEYKLMRKGQIIYTYFHFAADLDLAKACLDAGITAVAYETMRDSLGGLPLLRPMSEVAGSMAPLVGSYFLMKPYGGRGLLSVGVSGVLPANVVVIGGGVVGRNAARVAAGLGCRVTVLDMSNRVLMELRSILPANVFTEFSNEVSIETALAEADIVIGAVLIPGAKAPKLVKKEHLKIMRAGAVMVDVAIDQGGCFETSRPTSHDNPVYSVDSILHYCVANMPGAYARTSTFALNNATLAYGKVIAGKGIVAAARDDNAILTGLNIMEGKVLCKEVADALNLGSYYQDPHTL